MPLPCQSRGSPSSARALLSRSNVLGVLHLLEKAEVSERDDGGPFLRQLQALATTDAGEVVGRKREMGGSHLPILRVGVRG